MKVYEDLDQMENYEVLEPMIRTNYFDLDLMLQCAERVPEDYLYYELNMGAEFVGWARFLCPRGLTEAPIQQTSPEEY